MKHEKWLSCLIGAALAFGIALAGAGCLVTAFRLEPVDMGAVTGLCGLCAVICAVCFSFRRGWPVPAALAAVLIGYFAREGTLALETESLLHKVTTFYHMGYGWGTVGWSGIELAAVPVTGGLVLIGAVVSAAVSWAVCRRKGAFFAVALGFLPLGACFVVTDSIPQEGWLFLMFACFALLLLTQSVRRQDPKAAVRLTALLLVPVVLVSALLFRANPRDGHKVRMETAQQTLLSWLNGLPFVVTTPEGNLTISVDGMAAAQVDLSAVGPKTQMQYAVMDVVAQNGGLIYLRGQSLDSYDGLSWKASPVSTGEDMYFPTENLQSAGQLTVSVRMPQSRRYVPYYISSYALTDGAVANEGGTQEYDYQVMVPKEGYRHIPSSLTVDKNSPILHQCLQLPDETREAAEAILEDIFGHTALPRDTIFYGDTADRAEQICDYVRASAWYSLDTQQMPENEKDFAIWFLQESESGYCVHFASALAVLLRSAGIPARYVTGYTFEARSGSRVTVRADKAHAWVEYLDPNTGWTVLDATPAQWMEETGTEPVETEPDETEPTQTEPDETEPTETGPTETKPAPIQGTEPTETQPPDATEPTSVTGGASPGEKPKADRRWLWTALKTAAWMAGIAGVLAGQYWLRLRRRRRKMETGHPNQRALARWRYARRMARLIKAEPPQELEFLAEKAKFSQHTLTVQELMEFDLWLQEARKTLNEKPWYRRLAIKLIWAVG